MLALCVRYSAYESVANQSVTRDDERARIEYGLSATDTSSPSPRPVEVELGSMVFDEASETERDVDVTVKYSRDEGTTNVLAALEVKDHGRPLDITHVEQLSAKMNDMAAITDRAIVSASGFSEPAIRKGLAHGVRCLELEEWDPQDDVFPAGMTQWKTFRERVVAWDGLQIVFNPRDATSPELHAALVSNAPLVDDAGLTLEESNDVRSLIDVIARQESSHYARAPAFESLPVGNRDRIEVMVELEERFVDGRLSSLRSDPAGRSAG
jgi:hypothetical protein